MRKYQFFINAFIFISVAVLYFYPLININEIQLDGDWNYFNPLSRISRTAVLLYKELPLYDPWSSGGSDILANPQSRIFSPLFLLDILFSPQLANILSLVVTSIIGLAGMFIFLRHLKIQTIPAITGSIIFIFSQWFSLHFSVGHIPFGSLQLLGWFAYFYSTILRTRSLIWISMISAFCLLDGGIYAFVFGNLLGLSICAIKYKTLIKFIKRNGLPIKNILTGLLLFLFMACPKLLPTLSLHHKRMPAKEDSVLVVENISNVFFNPFLDASKGYYGTDWKNHEIGDYLGGVLLVLITIACLSKLKPIKFLKATSLGIVGSGLYYLAYTSIPWSYIIVELQKKTSVKESISLITTFGFSVVFLFHYFLKYFPKKAGIYYFLIICYLSQIFFTINDPLSVTTYISFALLPFASILITNWKQYKLKERFLAMSAIVLWTASGWGEFINPWSIFQSIPLISNAHVQSRLLIIFNLYLIAGTFWCLRKIRFSKKIWILILALSILETQYVFKNHLESGIQHSSAKDTPLVTQNSLKETVAYYIKRDLYDANVGSKKTYEPAAAETFVVNSSDPHYHGEIYNLKSYSKYNYDYIRINEFQFTPGSAASERQFLVNLNYLAGWRIKPDSARIEASIDGRILVSVPPGVSTAKCYYKPWYLTWIITFYFFGIISFFFILISRRNLNGKI